ncbi:lysophospholipid acyltransferase family protein [Haliovirga abyssi]|uniref:Lipid A biosynthesis lauroyl acyltransferase n=1 Tax=Haliovirga abyssi TaxID=2996794 RepID=A0AAU9DT75_9FUSO|nr:lysophospholipid acyltransferase family protein [Haliovirga abyssi]BDU50319.1 lipid A biosynthesis lauroyl acyltransferase [Haliovirga abyssi]
MKKEIKYRFEVSLYYIIKFFILLFPMKIRYKIAEFFGVIIYKLLKIRKRVTLKNLEIAFPEADNITIEKIALESYKNISKTFFELLWLDEIKTKLVGREKLDVELKKGKGVILLSLHIDNWEILGQELGKSGYNVYGVAKSQSNKILDEIINNIRTKHGAKVIFKGRNSSRLLIKALRENAILGLISDQYTNDSEVIFFNKKTKAPTGAAVLALKFDVPVFLAYTVREKDNTHIFYFEKKIDLQKTGDDKQDIKTNTQICTSEIEKVIRKYPEQWFWQHDRWRIK